MTQGGIAYQALACSRDESKCHFTAGQDIEVPRVEENETCERRRCRRNDEGAIIHRMFHQPSALTRTACLMLARFMSTTSPDAEEPATLRSARMLLELLP